MTDCEFEYTDTEDIEDLLVHVEASFDIRKNTAMKIKLFILIVCAIFSIEYLHANKPDSVYIGEYQIEFIFNTDSMPTVRRYYFYNTGHHDFRYPSEPVIYADKPADKSKMNSWRENPQRQSQIGLSFSFTIQGIG